MTDYNDPFEQVGEIPIFNLPPHPCEQCEDPEGAEPSQVTEPEQSEIARLDSDRFPATYKARMIAAYPVIADMTADEAYLATHEEREAAFGHILASRNLRRTHELFLCECPPCPGRGNDGHRMSHCAECCFGTGVDADPDCPIHGEQVYRPGESS